VRSRLQLSARFSATLLTRSHSACRWSHFTTSTAVIISICPAGAGNATYHTWWPSICRRWGSCLEYPTRLHHRLLVIAHFQTISEDLSIQSIILSTFCDCVKRPSSSLCRLRRFKIVCFTLHYIITVWNEKWAGHHGTSSSFETVNYLISYCSKDASHLPSRMAGV